MLYFSGLPADLGIVHATPHASFSELGEFISKNPVRLKYTRAEFFALTHKEQNKAKHVNYIVPSVFAKSPSPRKTELALRCNLIAHDIDDPDEAQRLLVQGWAGLGDLGHIVWHTARSTPTAPRLRVIVSADGIHPSRYALAVKSIADLLGLELTTHESLVPVQPMFLPTMFADSTVNPTIAFSPGEAFTSSEILELTPHETNAGSTSEDGVADLAFFREPMVGVDLETARSALAVLDPDCSMQQWISVASGLKHQFGDAGLAVWDEWSAKGAKYVDQQETEYRWGTLKANPADRQPVTLRSVLKLAKSRGWSDVTISRKAHAETVNWLRNPSRSTEELFDQGVSRIAKISPVIGFLERKSLIMTLRDVLGERQTPLPLNDIRRAVNGLEAQISKTTGTPPWAKTMCFITSTNLFYDYHRDQKFTPEVMDLIHPLAAVGDDRPQRARDYLVNSIEVPQVEAKRYDPTQGPKRIFKSQGVYFVNSYQALYPKPDTDRADEAGEIFTEHVKNLVREKEYQRLLLDFLAYQVQFPGKKVRWATLIQSTKGCGKTFIAAAMSTVLGRKNVRKLSASNVMESRYNGWATGSQLVVLEEVRVIGHNRYEVMDQLKPCISDDEISVREMYEPVQTVPNVTNYLMFTNHQDSIAIQDDDRRYFVLASKLQRVEDVNALGGDKYFNRLYGMLSDNPGGLRSFFEQWKISDEFKPEGRAPVTQYMHDLVKNAASPMVAAILTALEDEGHPLVRKDLLSQKALRDILETLHLPVFTDQTVACALRELGWNHAGRFTVEGERQQLWFKRPFDNILTTASERYRYL